MSQDRATAQELVRESNEVSGIHGKVNKFRIGESLGIRIKLKKNNILWLLQNPFRPSISIRGSDKILSAVLTTVMVKMPPE